MHYRLRRSGWLLTVAMLAVGYGLDVLGLANRPLGLGLLGLGVLALVVWALSLMIPTSAERRARQRRTVPTVPEEPPSTFQQAMVVFVTHTRVRQTYFVLTMLAAWTLMTVGVYTDQDYFVGIGILGALGLAVIGGIFDNLYSPQAIKKQERSCSYRICAAIRSWFSKRWPFR